MTAISPKYLPAAKGGDATTVVRDFAFAGADDVDAVAGFEVLIAEVAFAGHAQLDEVGGKEEADEPIHRHAEFAIEVRQFEEIDGAPEEPGEEAGDFEAEDLCDGGAMAQRAPAGELDGFNSRMTRRVWGQTRRMGETTSVRPREPEMTSGSIG